MAAHAQKPARHTLKASRVLAFLLRVAAGACAMAWLGGCAAPSSAAALDTSAFTERRLPADQGQSLVALYRSARAAPLRYRVIVLPGSGCAGMGPLAERYFAGLLHAQVLVLHKPGVDAQARTAPGDCAHRFVQADALGAWREHARAALRADAAQRAGTPALAQVLVGISEGAELLAALAPEVPHLAGLVLLGASGLDPWEAGALQAQRLGAAAQWQALAGATASAGPDSWVLEGRSLGYWRGMRQWPLAAPLIDGPWPILQVWGEEDALVPASAYERFALRARGRVAPYCQRRLPGADHGLQRADGYDGVQWVWAWLENWARASKKGLCAELMPGACSWDCAALSAAPGLAVAPE
ncbi:MAG: alpha/beta hydrolase [Simplicispira sp.]|nr:alpha/beta hydrolase [Simplicispira sp.]